MPFSYCRTTRWYTRKFIFCLLFPAREKVLSAGLVGGGGWWVALKTRETGQLLADCHLIRRNQIASGGSRLIIFCFFFLFQWEIVIKYIYLEIDKGYIYIHIEQLLFLSCMFLWRQIVARMSGLEGKTLKGDGEEAKKRGWLAPCAVAAVCVFCAP